MIREVVSIDEDKCNGCGLCVPACQEGAIRIVNGKAKLVADHLCDGLGACLGHCPQGAITIERREADDFNEEAVAAHLGKEHQADQHTPVSVAGSCPGSQFQSLAEPLPGGGCPSARLIQFGSPGAPKCPVSSATGPTASTLTHWPVKLRLLNPTAPVLQRAGLLIAADCVPVAFPAFQSRLLRGRAVVIGCPKFDDIQADVDKLTAIIERNDLVEIVVAHMEVPCCNGLLMATLQARRRTGRPVPIADVVIGIRGDVLSWRKLRADQ
ncbi:MAG TPA: 4Fe-4S binding protein [Phycisphaerae bacterium]|nr:4Fe-4S binding protein [Phycisphaerae bacterium]HRR85325.1 4Fe-4S binding protein [Phycisphaerae bacterium]